MANKPVTVKHLKERLKDIPDDAFIDIQPIEYGGDAQIVIWPASELERWLNTQPFWPNTLDVISNQDEE